MRRLRFFLISMLWIGAVAWYWRENVPLVPSRFVDVPPNYHAGMLSPAGELVVIPMRGSGSGRRLTRHGPLEFWTFPEVRKVRETLTADDEIVWGPNHLGSEALIRRNGSLLLVDAFTGERLMTLPDLAGVKQFRMAPGGQQVLVQQDRDIHLFESGQLEPRWTLRNFRLSGGVSGGIFIATSHTNPSANLWTAGVATAIDVSSGEIDHRFDHAGPSREIELSADGRWAVLKRTKQKGSGNQFSVCDAATGTLLWTIPLAPRIGYCWFEKGGSNLLGFEAAISDERLFRWDAADGTPRPPPTSADLRVLNWQATSEGQYAFAYSNVVPPGLMISWLNSSTWLPTKFREWLWSLGYRERIKIIDHQSERLVGYLPNGERAVVLPDNLGFATFSPGGRISYYSLPLRHDWTWLALWSLVPPASLVLLSGLRQRLRFRPGKRPPAAGVPA